MMDEHIRRSRQMAVAVNYRPKDGAPKVGAQGKGLLAQSIIQKAKDAGVHIHKDPELAEDLVTLDIGAHIPPEMYDIVAQILSFICELDELAGKPPRFELEEEKE